MQSKLKFATLNCQGFKKRMYKYIKQKFNECDVLLLQETWLYNFQHKHFTKIIPTCQYHAVSAMNEAEDRRIRRPPGGAMLSFGRRFLKYQSLQSIQLPIEYVP